MMVRLKFKQKLFSHLACLGLATLVLLAAGFLAVEAAAKVPSVAKQSIASSTAVSNEGIAQPSRRIENVSSSQLANVNGLGTTWGQLGISVGMDHHRPCRPSFLPNWMPWRLWAVVAPSQEASKTCSVLSNLHYALLGDKNWPVSG